MNDASAHLRQLGLTRPPFPPTPDADCYFHTPQLERELAEAAHCLLARKGFVLLTGEVGTGKSTFVRRLLGALDQHDVVASLVFNTFLQGGELLAAVLDDFGIDPGTDAAANIARFNAFLIERWRTGTTCVLIIDDAQNLTLDSLELLRLLSNLETGQEKLLQIVLVGQPELGASLARAEIRQLTSRIVKHVQLDALDAQATARYVDFRLSAAGAAGRVSLTPAAHTALHRCARGNPRRVHLIMDRCLYGVVANHNGVIDAKLITQAAAEAGVQTTRGTPHRRQWAAAAMVALATVGLAGAGFALHATAPSPEPVPVATNAPTPASATVKQVAPQHAVSEQAALEHAAPRTTATVASNTAGTCLAHLNATTAASVADIQLQRVPQPWVKALQTRRDLCLEQRDGGWTVVWRPRLRPEHFVSGQRGASVRTVQSALAGQGLYRGASDGLFGPLTRDALTRFQRRHGLDATGAPDALTLFLIEVGLIEVALVDQSSPPASAQQHNTTTTAADGAAATHLPEDVHGHG